MDRQLERPVSRTPLVLFMVAALVLALLPMPGATADDTPGSSDDLDGVLITETANGGPGGDGDGQTTGVDNFILLQNHGEEAVDLTGWEVYRCTGGGGLASAPQVPAFSDLVLDAGETFLLAHNNSPLADIADATYSGSLANGGFGVLVRDGDGETVDRMGAYGTGGSSDSACVEGEALPNDLSFSAAESFQRVSDTGNNADDFVTATRTVDPDTGAPDGEGVRITETANGGPGGGFDTFIELTNLGDEPVDVEGFEVYRCFASGNLASSPQVPAFGEVVLEPGESILLAHEDFTGDVEPDALYFGTNNLANGGFGVLVQDANGEVVDRFSAHTGNPGSPCVDGDEFPDQISFSASESFQRVTDTGDNATDFEIGERDPQALGRDLYPEPEEREPGVRITQTANGGPGTGFDNFIQITNLSDEEVDVSGWEVYRCFASGDLASDPQVPAFHEVILEPDESILLAHEGFTGPDPDATYAGFDSLANNGFGVLVQDADGAVVDRFAAHTGNPDSPCADGTEFPTSLTFADAEAYHRVADFGDNATDFEIAERDPQALGRPILPEPLPICEVMGPGLHSPFVEDIDPERLANLSEESVTTTGIVYAAQTNDDFNNGFWMQMADDDDSDCPEGASRGIYVFVQSIRSDTPSMPELGDEVTVTGPINEFFGESTQLQVNNPSGYPSSLHVTSTGNPLPEPTVIDSTAAAAQDVDRLYYASLHQARVELEFGQTYVGTSKFGETWVVPTAIDERIRRTDERYDNFALADENLPDGGPLNVFAFDEVEGAVGPLDHSFNNYKLIVEDVGAVTTTDNPEARPHPIQEQPAGTYSVATWNIEDIFGDPAIIAEEEGIEVLAPSDLDEEGNPIAQPDRPDVSVVTPPLEERERRRDMVALAVVDWMNKPAVIHIQEVANETLLAQMATRINEEIDDRGLDGEYEAVYVPGIDERYIDVGYLLDVTRVEYDPDSLEKIDIDAPATVPPGDPDDTGKCAQGPGGEFLHDRAPLRIDVTDLATSETFTHVTIHNKSRFGGTAANEEFEPCRVQQTQSVIDYLEANELATNVIIGGDINTFRQSPTLDLYESEGFVPMVDLIPEDRRLSYQFDGRVQFLDHLIVTPDVAARISVVDSPKIINDTPFPEGFEDGSTAFGASDHEPIIAYVGESGFDHLRSMLDQMIDDGAIRPELAARVHRGLDRSEDLVDRGNVRAAQANLDALARQLEAEARAAERAPRGAVGEQDPAALRSLAAAIGAFAASLE